MDQCIKIEGLKKTVFGAGAVNLMGEECKVLNAAKALLVMDRDLAKTDICEKILSILKKSRVKVVLYPEAAPEPDPRIADIGADLAKKEKVRCVIGVGGGSTMDVAKAIGVLVANPGKAADYIGLGLVKKPGLPTIMAPTTAGTGSEATFTSVFTMRDTKTKGGINSPFLYPNTAVIDPELSMNLSPTLTAFTGMDALTHAIESYTSLQAHFMSESVSLRAIELISGSLRGAVFNGADYRHRENMMKGSYLAGLGLAMAGVGAVHALAYPLGAYFDIPHGLANAVMLPYVLEYNFPGNVDKFCQMALAMDEPENGQSRREFACRCVKGVFDLSRDIGVPGSLKDLGIPEEAIPQMAKAAIKVERPILNNPRPTTVDALEAIYRRAFHGAPEGTQ